MGNVPLMVRQDALLGEGDVAPSSWSGATSPLFPARLWVRGMVPVTGDIPLLVRQAPFLMRVRRRVWTTGLRFCCGLLFAPLVGSRVPISFLWVGCW